MEHRQDLTENSGFINLTKRHRAFLWFLRRVDALIDSFREGLPGALRKPLDDKLAERNARSLMRLPEAESDRLDSTKERFGVVANLVTRHSDASKYLTELQTLARQVMEAAKEADARAGESVELGEGRVFSPMESELVPYFEGVLQLASLKAKRRAKVSQAGRAQSAASVMLRKKPGPAADMKRHRLVEAVIGETPVPKRQSTASRNIDKYRRECGWSFDDLARRTGLEKKLIVGHISHGKKAFVRTLKIYADAFSRELKRPVTVLDLER